MDAEDDFTNRFNTPLPAEQAEKYKAWLATLPQQQQSTYDYDMQGAFLSGAGRSANGHFPDTFKKPNHPTFSKESKYSGQEGYTGGEWVKSGDKWQFKASDTNLRFHDPEDLQHYFSRVEKGNELVLPESGGPGSWPGQEVQAWPGQEAAPSAPLSDVQKSWLSTTSVGRVMSAFGAGAEEPFEDGQLGLSQSVTDAMRRAGVFRSDDPNVDASRGPLTRAVQTFNEAMIIPAARDLDGMFREAVISPFTSLARGLGQLSEETGIATKLGYYDYGKPGAQADDVRRDILGAIDTLGIVMGAHADLPVGTTAARRRRIAAQEGVREEQIPSATKEGAPKVPTADPVPMPTPEETVNPPGYKVLASDEGLRAHQISMPAGPDTPRLQSSEQPEKAGNINLDRINAPEDVKQVIRDTAAANNDFTTARRGAMTFEDIQNLSDAIGMTPEELTKRKVGQAFNAEQAVAARNLLVQSAQNVRDLAQAARGGTDEAIAQFQQAMTRHAAIQEQVAGMTAEAGRALASFNIKAGEADQAKALSDLIKANGGRENAEAMIDAINNLDTPEQVSRFVRDSRKATTLDKIVEAWMNGLLSGPVTHVTNTVSNSLVALNGVAESATAAIVGKLHSGEKVTFGEAKARAFATIQGAKEGLIAARRAWSEEQGASIATGKVEARRPHAIEGTAGKVIRTPTRLLGAEDAFFQGIAKRQELAAQATRKASAEGLEGDAFRDRVAQLMANPDEKMIEKADESASYQTFNRPLGDMGQAVQKFFNSHPVLKFVAPFIRTPVDIVKYAGERTPLSLFSKEVRANLAGKNGNVARDTQAARLALGTAVTTTALSLAASGHITGGGPTDPKARALLYMTGWQPYSVKIGDSYYSYSRLDPFATMLGVTADAYEIHRTLSESESSDIGGLLLASVSKNLLNKTWLQGPADLLQAVEDPERYGSAWLASFTSSFVPTLLAQQARAQDPYFRQARTMLDAFKARIPGLSETLLPKRDLWGNPVAREGAAGPDILSPIYETQIKNDVVAREMLRLGVWKAQVPNKIRGVTLTPEQWDTYQQIAGHQARMTLDSIVGKPGWEKMPAHAQSEIISRAFDSARAMARTYMLVRYPDVLMGSIQNRVKEFTGAGPKQGLVVAPPNPEFVQ